MIRKAAPEDVVDREGPGATFDVDTVGGGHGGSSAKGRSASHEFFKERTGS